MSNRPIFVVGFQRSGTTLLQSLLGAHSRIAAPPEVHFFFRIHQLRDYWGDLADDTNAARVVHELVNAPYGLLDGCGFDETALTQAFRRTDRSYGALLQTLLVDFATRAGKPRWSEKTPHQAPGLIWSLVPDAQVVHIVRDPREVIASAVTAWPHAIPAWVLAERLREFTDAALSDGRAASADSYRLVRYEDLASSPERELREICAFLDEDFEPQMTSADESRETAVPQSRPSWQTEAAGEVRAPGRHWHHRLSVTQRALVSATLRDTIRDLGYPPVTRRWLVAAAVLAPMRLPARVAERRRVRKARGATSPQERYEAVQEFLRSRQVLSGDA